MISREEAKVLRYKNSEFNYDNIDDVIDVIYNSFENRVCDTCKHYGDFGGRLQECDLLVSEEAEGNHVTKSFGCNKWSSK